jgi:hypothetical protein
MLFLHLLEEESGLYDFWVLWIKPFMTFLKTLLISKGGKDCVLQKYKYHKRQRKGEKLLYTKCPRSFCFYMWNPNPQYSGIMTWVFRRWLGDEVRPT